MPCFDFFADASNLEALTPPFLEFQILTPRPIPMRLGAIIEYRLSLLGVPLRWVTRIEEWAPGLSFTDVQVRGPYAKWVHRHTFLPVREGTTVRDEVEYRLPLAPLSTLVHEAFVRPRLRQIFEYRSAMIAQLVG